MWESIQRDGFDASIPIGLRSGREIKRTHGKTIEGNIYAGDGCHRIACLSVLGMSHLPPDLYRVRVRPVFEPRDNTAALIKLGVLDRRTYLGFLSGSYCDGQVHDSADGIREFVALHKPTLLAELDSVLAFDLPNLNGGDGYVASSGATITGSEVGVSTRPSSTVTANVE
jgi:hypothetical protein